MFEEIEIKLDLFQENIRNLSTDSFGNYIAITSQNNIITNNFKLNLNFDLYFPKVKIIDENRFLVVDDRRDNKENAFIFDNFGHIQSKFYVGFGIEDILINNKKIVISYFDEGVLGNDGPNNEGLSVFDFKGKFLYGYNSNADNIMIDCYCICIFGKNILFYGYDDFKLRELNLLTFEVNELQNPKEFLGSSAMSNIADKIIFFSSYKEKDVFYFWNFKNNKLEKVETKYTNLKGIDNGCFYKFEKKSFTIIKTIF